MAKMGRPSKLKDSRKPYTIYLDSEMQEAIDAYVFKEKQSNPGYSRSDFLNEAAAAYLKRKRG